MEAHTAGGTVADREFRAYLVRAASRITGYLKSRLKPSKENGGSGLPDA